MLALVDPVVEADDRRGVSLLEREPTEDPKLLKRAPQLVLEVRGPDLEAGDPVLGPAHPGAVVERRAVLQPGPQLLRIDVAGGHVEHDGEEHELVDRGRGLARPGQALARAWSGSRALSGLTAEGRRSSHIPLLTWGWDTWDVSINKFPHVGM